MSALNFGSEEANLITSTPARLKPTDFYDNLQATWEVGNVGRFHDSADSQFETRATDISTKYKELTGRSLSEKLDRRFSQLGSKGQLLRQYEELSDSQIKLLDDEIREVKTKQPEKFRDLETFSDARRRITNEAMQKAGKEDLDFQLSLEGNPNSFSKYSAVVLGSLGAGLLDARNVIGSLALGGASGALTKTGASTMANVMRIALSEAGINAAIEVGQQELIADWHEQLGREYGFGDMAFNVGIAGLGGAVIGGLVSGAAAAFTPKGFAKQIANRMSGFELPAAKLVKDQNFINFMNEINTDPSKFLKRLYESDLDRGAKDMVTDTYRQVKAMDRLGLPAHKAELQDRIINNKMSGVIDQEQDFDDLISLVMNIDRRLEDIPQRSRTKGIKAELEDIFAKEFEVLRNIKTDDVPDSFINKLLQSENVRDLSENELLLGRKLGLVDDSNKIQKPRVEVEAGKRQRSEKGFNPASQATDTFIRERFKQAPKPEKLTPDQVGVNKGRTFDAEEMDFAKALDGAYLYEKAQRTPLRSLDELTDDYVKSVERIDKLNEDIKTDIGFVEELGDDIDAIRNSEFSKLGIFDGGDTTLNEVIAELDLDQTRLTAIQDCAGGGA